MSGEVDWILPALSDIGDWLSCYWWIVILVILFCVYVYKTL